MSQFYSPEVGAPQVRLSAIVKELQERGHVVEVATAMPNYPTGRIFEPYRGRFLASEEIEGARVHRVWIPTATGSGFRRVLSLLGFPVLLPFALAKVTRPDLVLVNSVPLTFAPTALLAARRWRSVAVLGISDLWPDSLISGGLIRGGRLARWLHRFEAQMYRRFDYVSPVTDSVARILETEKGVDASKVVPLLHGVDCELFAPADERSQSDPAHFVYCGTVGYMHGADVVLDAMELLGDARPEVRFSFIGGGSEWLRLKESAASRGISSITFESPIPPAALAARLPQFTAGVVTLRDIDANLPNRSAKTFPIMSSGLPVLLAGRGETADLVTESDAGLVVPPNDPHALADGMCWLLDNPEGARSMGRSGRTYAEASLSWRASVGEWLHRVTASQT